YRRAGGRRTEREIGSTVVLAEAADRGRLLRAELRRTEARGAFPANLVLLFLFRDLRGGGLAVLAVGEESHGGGQQHRYHREVAIHLCRNGRGQLFSHAAH